MWEDPIVNETRRIRREIEAECGNDFEELARRAVQVQQQYPDKVVSQPSGLKEERTTISATRV